MNMIKLSEKTKESLKALDKEIETRVNEVRAYQNQKVIIVQSIINEKGVAANSKWDLNEEYDLFEVTEGDLEVTGKKASTKKTSSKKAATTA